MQNCFVNAAWRELMLPPVPDHAAYEPHPAKDCAIDRRGTQLGNPAQMISDRISIMIHKLEAPQAAKTSFRRTKKVRFHMWL